MGGRGRPAFAGWKAALLGCALLALALVAYELAHGVPVIWSGVSGRLGVDKQELAATSDRWRVTDLEPWSPLVAQGVAVGDVLVADRRRDLARTLRAGESIGLSVTHAAGVTRHIVVTAVERPTPLDELKLFYLLNGFVNVAAIAFIGFALGNFPVYSPADWPQRIERFFFHLALVPPWFALLWFAIHYPDEAPSRGLRARLRRARPVLATVAVLATLVTAHRGLGRETPWFFEIYDVVVTLFGISVLAAFWEGWRRSSGVLKQRFAWLFGTFAIGIVPSVLASIAEALSWDVTGWVFLLMAVGALVMFLGLVYAVLRHRVLDFGVAVNRSIVVAFAGLVLLGAFNLLQFAARRFVPADAPIVSALLGAALAVATFVAYRRARPWAERLVERVFFARAVEREAELQRFAEEAARHVDPGALAQASVAAIDRFTGGAGAALYALDDDDEAIAKRLQSSRLDVPERIGPDHPLRVTLQGGAAVVPCQALGSTGAQVALPLLPYHGGEAFVLIGAHADGEPLAADEVEALRGAALRIGQHLQAARLAALRRRIGAPRPAGPSVVASDSAPAA